jgi:hypothetical protein
MKTFQQKIRDAETILAALRNKSYFHPMGLSIALIALSGCIL